MESKVRPFSSKPVTSIPLYTEQIEPELVALEMTHTYQPYLNKGKPKLNQIMPELPSFGIKGNSTAMLYSKFVVKGLKEDKLSVVKSALKKKQQITETGITYQNQANKSTRTFTNQKTVENGGIFEVQSEHKALPSNNSFLQINNLVRASSAKTFIKAAFQQSSEKTERALFRNSTQTNLSKLRKRPTTANPIRQQKQPNQSNQNKSYRGRQPRPTTATPSRQKNMMQRYSYSQFEHLDEIVARKTKEKPIKIEDSKGVDYIQRNIQNLNSYNRKASSIYLTATNIQNMVSNRKKSKQAQALQAKAKNTNNENAGNELQLKPQQLFINKDKQKHEKQMRKIQNYLIESTPSKFQLISEQLKKEQKRNKVDENYQQLLSKDLDNHFKDTHQEINQKSAKACYEDYIQSCEVMQYNIASKLKPIQDKQQVRNTLNIWECQKLLNLYKNFLSQRVPARKTQIINEIRNIVKDLKYFSHKSKQQIDRLFTVPFQIVIAEEGVVLIEPNTQVEAIYIILNGSVVAQSLISTSQGGIGSFIHHSQVSLYDGENFGEISRPSQNLYKEKVTALEQSLLMKIRYNDYINILLEGNEIQQKLQILKLAFKSQLNSDIITQEDLQMISLSLQKYRYPAKSLVFRQGEIYDKLVIIAKGKLAAINEYILQQNKVQQKDMKMIDQIVKQQPQSYMLKRQESTNKFMNAVNKSNEDKDRVALSDMRRENLINYEVVRQNNKKLYYYFMKQQTQFVKGDTVNWEPILNSFSIPIASTAMEQSITAIFNLGLNFIAKPTRFSLISNADDTQVYTLSSHAFQYLPNQLKKTILEKGKKNISKQIKVQSAKDIKQWNQYKNKLCDQILKDKKQRASKMRL